MAALVSRSMTSCLVFALLGKHVWLWIWLGRSDSAALMGLLSGLLPTVAGMAPSQKCHAETYGCDGHKSLWSGIESAVKKLSVPSVLYAFQPPSVRSSSCQILNTTLWNPSLSILFFWFFTDRFQGTFTCSCSSQCNKVFLLRLVTMPLYGLLSSRSVLWGSYFISL